MKRILTAALLLALATPAARAGGPKPSRPDDLANKNTGATVPSDVVERQVARLSTLVEWHTSLDEAEAQAQKEQKPIFWVHVLGDLDGSC
jgi:hypothetical protein